MVGDFLQVITRHTSTDQAQTSSCLGLRISKNEFGKKIFFSSVTSPTCTEKCCCVFARSHLTLWDPMNCSPPGTSVHGIFQARTLEYSPGDLPDPGNRTVAPTASPTLRADSFNTEPSGKPAEGY